MTFKMMKDAANAAGTYVTRLRKAGVEGRGLF